MLGASNYRRIKRLKRSIRLSLHIETWPANRPFRITGKTWQAFEAVVVEVADGSYVGRGEGLGVYYFGETATSITKQIEDVAANIEAGISRDELQTLLPPGGARNAVDCALWDLESKRLGASIWQLTGVHARPVTTVYTIGIEENCQLMAAHAAEAAKYPILKVKLDGHEPLQRVQAIRRVRPDARLIVDANQAWTFTQLTELLSPLLESGVEMIEQPLALDADDQLEGFKAAIPLGADESCQDRRDLNRVAKRYQVINIKLDKTGGLTEALLLADEARALGLDLMVGSMGGTSLSMAPSFVIAQMCRFFDLDGPLLLKHDRLPGMKYDGVNVSLPDPTFWG
ncbi:MAG: dipeptide epimerase [Gammaproteobacteria bacterium]|nr:dipeptide epimerase [Gammaproteobacteria bacterium]